jgi:hypothetical protein
MSILGVLALVAAFGWLRRWASRDVFTAQHTPAWFD